MLADFLLWLRNMQQTMPSTSTTNAAAGTIPSTGSASSTTLPKTNVSGGTDPNRKKSTQVNNKSESTSKSKQVFSSIRHGFPIEYW